MSDTDEDCEPNIARGEIIWECSEPDGAPDIGICVGLGGKKILRIGQISKSLHEEGGDEVAALGDDYGWWLVIYGHGDGLPLAKFSSAMAAREFMDIMAAALSPTPEQKAREAGAP